MFVSCATAVFLDVAILRQLVFRSLVFWSVLVRRLHEFRIPSSVKRIGPGAFSTEIGRKDIIVSCDDSGYRVCGGVLLNLSLGIAYGLVDCVCYLCIPDYVRELCDYCFCKSKSLLSVRFGERSLLERIGLYALSGTGLSDIFIPRCVCELCEGCLSGCGELRRVSFWECCILERFGKCALSCSGISDIHIPDSVIELCDRCFWCCGKLSSVTFGVCPSLEIIGRECFTKSGLTEFRIPSSVQYIGCKALFECPLVYRPISSDTNDVGNEA